MKHNLFSRFISVLLAVVMLAGLMSMPSLAEAVTGVQSGEAASASSQIDTQSAEGVVDNLEEEDNEEPQEPDAGSEGTVDEDSNVDIDTQDPAVEGTQDEGSSESEADNGEVSQTVDGQALLDELMAMSDEELLSAVQSLSDEQVAALEDLGGDALSGLLERLKTITSSSVEESEEPVAVVDYNSMSGEELYNYLCSLTDDATYVQVMDSLSEEKKAELWDYLDSISTGESDTVTEDNGIVNFLNAAPLVTAAPAASRPMMMRAMAKQSGVGTAFATSNVTAPDGLEISKTLNYDSETDEYTLTLEAYVTGNVQAGESKPVDVILVLDQSGSMDDPFAYQYNPYDGENNEVAYQYNRQLYVKGADDQYYPVRIERDDIPGDPIYVPVDGNTSIYSLVNQDLAYSTNGEEFESLTVESDWGYCTVKLNGETIYQGYPIRETIGDISQLQGGTVYRKTTQYTYDYTYTWNEESGTQTVMSSGATTKTPVQLYTRGDSITKLDALKTAVSTFVDEIASANQQNKIAIVGFASSGYNSNTEILTLNNGKGKSYGNGNNLSNTDYQHALVGASDSIVDKAISNLDGEGATRADLGMVMANRILEQYQTDGRSKVVVMFTDGEPNDNNGFDNDVASATIYQAHTAKNTYNATVYTVGIFNGADGSNPGNANQAGQTNQYMHAVSSNYPSAQGKKYDDDRSGWWKNQLGTVNPSVVGSDEAYYLSAKNTEALNEVFSNISEEVGSASVPLDATTVLYDEMSPYFDVDINEEAGRNIKVYTANALTIDGDTVKWAAPVEDKSLYPDDYQAGDDTIKITGFDYKDNYVAKVNDKVRGKKLILEIPVKYNEESFGGNNIPTNEGTSGIYNADGSTCYGNFEIPKASIPVDYAIEGQSQTIHLTQKADLSKLIGYADKESRTDFYKPDGIKNRYVDIDYQLKSSDDTVIGTLHVEAGDDISEATWNWTGEKQPGLTECTQYQLTCTVTPSEKHETTSKGEAAETTTYPLEGEDAVQPYVHVLRPYIKWQDSTRDYNTELTASVLNSHQVTGDFIWKDIKGDVGTPDPLEVAPALTYSFYDKSDNRITGTLLVQEKEVVVKVTANNQDITTYVDFDWQKDDDCACEDAPTDAQFRIHVGTGDLTITKIVTAAEGSNLTKIPNSLKETVFLFKVTGPNNFSTIVRLECPTSFGEGGKKSVTLTGLPAGQYTVKELPSLGFTCDDDEKTTAVGGATEIVPFTNTCDGDEWGDKENLPNTFTYKGDGTDGAWHFTRGSK